jgi:hypothetical protein
MKDANLEEQRERDPIRNKSNDSWEFAYFDAGGPMVAVAISVPKNVMKADPPRIAAART